MVNHMLGDEEVVVVADLRHLMCTRAVIPSEDSRTQLCAGKTQAVDVVEDGDEEEDRAYRMTSSSEIHDQSSTL